MIEICPACESEKVTKLIGKNNRYKCESCGQWYDSEEPASLSCENVQHWCRYTEQLEQTQVSKALKFVEYDCLRYLADKGFFVCLPLNTKKSHTFLGVTLVKRSFVSDYNSSEYIIRKGEGGTFRCNCQCFVMKERRGEVLVGGANCAHTLALFYAFKLGRFREGDCL